MFKKLLFIGLGGAGQRHLRIFRESLKNLNTEFIAYRSTGKTPLLNKDFTVNSNDSIDSFYNIKIYDDLNNAIAQKPDLAIISTPTSTHMKFIKICVENKISVFVEKPFSHSLDNFDFISNYVIKNKLFFYVSMQRRFHPLIQEISKIIKNKEIGEIINVQFNVNSYVPDWHKYENFIDLYACRKELGGGVLLTEIHEIDLAYWFFGMPKSVSCTGGSYSNLCSGVEDTVHMNLIYEGFSVQLNMSFMQRYTKRSFFVAGDKGYVECDFNTGKALYNYYENDKVIEKKEEYSNDDLFYYQAQAFLGSSINDSVYSLNSARDSIKIVDGAKQSMKNNKVFSF
jgi:predicted dehydrogenase